MDRYAVYVQKRFHHMSWAIWDDVRHQPIRTLTQKVSNTRPLLSNNKLNIYWTFCLFLSQGRRRQAIPQTSFAVVLPNHCLGVVRGLHLGFHVLLMGLRHHFRQWEDAPVAHGSLVFYILGCLDQSPHQGIDSEHQLMSSSITPSRYWYRALTAFFINYPIKVLIQSINWCLH